MAGTAQVVVDVWSDYVCPFCYLELPILEKLEAEMGRLMQVEWHPFELRPEPHPTLDPAGEYLKKTWATSVYPMAEQRRMVLRLPPVQPRSRKAFEAAFFARDEGAFAHMHHAIFKAFFEDGKDIGDPAVLVSLGISVGLDGDALSASLSTGRYTPRVLQEAALAEAVGINAVPVLVARRSVDPLAQAHALSGAVDYPRIKQLLTSLLQ